MKKIIFPLMILILAVSVLAAPIVDDPFIEQESSFLGNLFAFFQTQAIAINPTSNNVFEPGGEVHFVLDEVANAECTANTRFVVFIDGPASYGPEIGLSSQGSTVSAGNFLTDFFVWNVPSNAPSGNYEITNYYICGTSASSPKISGTNIISVSITGGGKSCNEQLVGERVCDVNDDVVQNFQRSDCSINPIPQIVEQCADECENGVCIDASTTDCQADLEGQICTSSQVCIQGTSSAPFTQTSDTSRCCVFGACGSQEDLQQAVEEEGDTGESTKIGIDWNRFTSATDGDYKNAACSETGECKTGRCIDLVSNQELQSFLDLFLPITELFKLFGLGEDSEELAERVARILEEEQEQGLCIINFNPVDEDNNLLPPQENCAKPYVITEPIPIISAGLGALGFDFDIPIGERCADALTKGEFKQATDAELFNTMCDENRNCNPRDEFDIDCVAQSEAGVEIPQSVEEKISDFFSGASQPGVCLATPTDCSQFIKDIGFLDITDDECTNGFIVVGAGILLIILILGAIGGRR